MYLIDQLGLEGYRQAVLSTWAELAAELGPDQAGDPEPQSRSTTAATW
jgi:hypothetical protein